MKNTPEKSSFDPGQDVLLDSRRLGILGEELAARSYRDEGFIMVENNYRCRFGELDFVALRDDVLVIVEVRTRREGALVSPAESVDIHKQRRIIAAAKHFLMSYPEFSECFVRFDVVEAYYQGGYRCRLNRIENAFTL